MIWSSNAGPAIWTKFQILAHFSEPSHPLSPTDSDHSRGKSASISKLSLLSVSLYCRARSQKALRPCPRALPLHGMAAHPQTSDSSGRDSLASSVNALSLLVASQQSKTALAKFKRRGLIERRLLAADELKAHELQGLAAQATRERTMALKDALKGLAAHVRLGDAQWRALSGQRVAFSACAGRPPTSTTEAVLQASWLVVPPLNALCRRDSDEHRVGCLSSASESTGLLAPPPFKVGASRSPTAAAVAEAVKLPVHDVGVFSTGGHEGSSSLVEAALPPAPRVLRAESRPFEAADSPLSNLRAFAFHPLFALAASADVCGAPLAGALVDPAAVVATPDSVGLRPSAATAPALPPSVVLCIAEFVADVLQVRGGGNPSMPLLPEPRAASAPGRAASSTSAGKARPVRSAGCNPRDLVFRGNQLPDPVASVPPASAYVFFSNLRTHDECIKRMLLGAPDNPGSARLLQGLALGDRKSVV